jgi:hypothetical protein
MPPTFKDFTVRREAQLAAERQRAMQQSVQIRQAKVKADLLTQHEGWDFFLSMLQAKAEEAKNEEFEWMQKSAVALSELDCKIAQLNYAIRRARVELLEEIMAIPSTLKGSEASGQPE